MVRAKVALFGSLALCSNALGLGQPSYIGTERRPANFVIADRGQASPVYVDADEYPGLVRAVYDMQADINKVTGSLPAIMHESKSHYANLILIGTLGKNALIDRLVRDKRIDASPIAGKWESFLLQTLSHPLPGIKRALVIVGSDKRGTVYGVYDLSEQIGVSPWYWWADVPIHNQDTLTVKPGIYRQGPPAVKYRGIFLND
jgi:hypothetical protein